MKRFILSILLMVVAATAVAQSGVFYDVDRKGEGVTVFDWVNLHHEAMVTFYFYTYDEHNGQRWLLGSDAWDEDGTAAAGLLYQTEGVNYPLGIPSNEPFEEDVMIVGEPYAVGEYVLRKAEDGGYLLWVSRLPEPDPRGIVEEKDYLYDRTWFFTYPLLEIK
jgi:hypothetical protein